MSTQLWMSYDRDGIAIASCPNAVRTHVQLDTLSRITDNKLVIGEWRVIANRRIVFTDSAVYSNKQIHRKSRIIYDEKNADVFLVITDNKFKMYGTEKDYNEYKKLPVKNYSIENGRFLLQYGLLKAGGTVTFIGMDKNEQLILSWHAVEERKIKGVYIT